MEELMTKHSEMMDRYDPEKRVGLIVDEWGNWFNVEPDTNPGFLYQQNTLRDAITAGVNLNIFNNHCDMVKMANIAQLVNVLQALFLTEGEKMILTPTFHVFDMYRVHHENKMLPVEVTCPTLSDDEGREFPQVSVSASIDANGAVHLSMVNTSATDPADISCALDSSRRLSANGGSMILSGDIHDYNSFDDPHRVGIEDFTSYKIGGNKLSVRLPAHSVVTISLK
jgi:alpha-N-arabinofuranosidase